MVCSACARACFSTASESACSELSWVSAGSQAVKVQVDRKRSVARFEVFMVVDPAGCSVRWLSCCCGTIGSAMQRSSSYPSSESATCCIKVATSICRFAATFGISRGAQSRCVCVVHLSKCSISDPTRKFDARCQVFGCQVFLCRRPRDAAHESFIRTMF